MSPDTDKSQPLSSNDLEPFPAPAVALKSPLRIAIWAGISTLPLLPTSIINWVLLNLSEGFFQSSEEALWNKGISYLNSYEIITQIELINSIPSLIFFFMWCHRVAANTLKLAPDETKFKSSASYIWSFFIPIINIYKPVIGMNSILTVSKQFALQQKLPSKNNLVGFWWISSILSINTAIITGLLHSKIPTLPISEIDQKIAIAFCQSNKFLYCVNTINLPIFLLLIYKVTSWQIKAIRRTESMGTQK